MSAIRNTPSVELREAGSQDLEAVAAVIDAESPGAGPRWRARMRWQAEHNPWSGRRVSGFVLLDRDRCVGHYFVIPQPMRVAGVAEIGLFGLDLFILPEYRGGFTSMNLIRAAHRLGQPAVVATTSANPASEAIWNRLGARPLADGRVSLIRPLRWLRLAMSAAARAVWKGPSPSVPSLAQAAANPIAVRSPGGGWSASIAHDYAASAGLWTAVRDHFTLATDRTAEFLAWRYGAGSPGGSVVELHDDAGRVRAWYAFRISRRGARMPARLFRVLDLIAAPDDTPAIDACVRDLTARARAAGADLIEARGMAHPFRTRLAAAGFRARDLPSNPFLVLPGARPLPAGDGWHLVTGDGDAGFD